MIFKKLLPIGGTPQRHHFNNYIRYRAEQKMTGPIVLNRSDPWILVAGLFLNKFGPNKGIGTNFFKKKTYEVASACPSEMTHLDYTTKIRFFG